MRGIKIIDICGILIVAMGALGLGGIVGELLHPIIRVTPLAMVGTAHYDEVESHRRQVRSLHDSRMWPDAVIPLVTGGLAPVIGRIETSRPVVFLTIDDGYFQHASVVDAMKRYKLRASMFLADLFIAPDPPFFAQLSRQGSKVENHTVAHDLMMTKKDYQYQRHEICGMNDRLTTYYGQRPTLFRPPGGRYNRDTERAVADCGLRAIVLWSARIQKGAIEYQDGRTSLRSGDIVLMHFRPEFVADIEAFVQAARAAHLHVDLLERWIH